MNPTSEYQNFKCRLQHVLDVANLTADSFFCATPKTPRIPIFIFQARCEIFSALGSGFSGENWLARGLSISPYRMNGHSWLAIKSLLQLAIELLLEQVLTLNLYPELFKVFNLINNHSTHKMLKQALRLHRICKSTTVKSTVQETS